MIEPDSYHDNLNVRHFSLLTAKELDAKVDQYGDYMQRPDLMPRARAAGNRVLDHLLFEYGFRDGIFNEYLLPKIEDEVCDAA